MADTITTQETQFVVIKEDNENIHVVTVAEGTPGRPGAVAQAVAPAGNEVLWIDTSEESPTWDGNTLPIGNFIIKYNPVNDTLEFRYK